MQSSHPSGHQDQPRGEVVLLHTSDMHLVQERSADGAQEDNLLLLDRVLAAAARWQVDVVLLVGDTFDHNRVADTFVQRAAERLAKAGRPVVVLPGNHDPLVAAESVYFRAGLDRLPNLTVLGRATRGLEAVSFPHLDLEVWGRPHLDYSDMAPLETIPPRRTRWQVALAHGHVEAMTQAPSPYRPSWLISYDQIEGTGADYVALGHWNRRACVSSATVLAYYSGAIETCGTVNIVRLGENGQVTVTAEVVAEAENTTQS